MPLENCNVVVFFLCGYIFMDTHVCSYPAYFKACQTVETEKVVELIRADVKFLFAPLFVVVTCLCSADAFGVETGFEFSCCCLCLSFSPVFHFLWSPCLPEIGLTCAGVKGSWNMYITLVLWYLVLWLSRASGHFLDPTYALWFLFSWAS